MSSNRCYELVCSGLMDDSNCIRIYAALREAGAQITHHKIQPQLCRSTVDSLKQGIPGLSSPVLRMTDIDVG